jgi:hypothetical protein
MVAALLRDLQKRLAQRKSGPQEATEMCSWATYLRLAFHSPIGRVREASGVSGVAEQRQKKLSRVKKKHLDQPMCAMQSPP